MKKALCLPIFFYISMTFLAAHDHSIFLAKGQAILGLNLIGVSGNWVEMLLPDTEAEIETLLVNVGTPMINTGWAGEMISFEYALLDGFSLGVKSNPIQNLVGRLGEGAWNFQGAVYANLNLTQCFAPPEKSALGLFWYEEFQLAPIYTQSPGSGDGLANLASVLSVSYRLAELENFSLSPYIDFKALTTFPHPYCKFRWMTPEFYLGDIYAIGLTPADDLAVELLPSTKFVAALGLDMTFLKHLVLFVGLNLPFGTVRRGLDNSTLFESDTPYFGLERWEFEFKYLF
jgi:hypothetical protein